MKFSVLSDSLEKMESTTKRIELTDILVELLKNTHASIISKVIYLIQGKIRPNFEGVELGIAEKLVIRAISKSSGITTKKIEDDYNDGGDLGKTGANILRQKTQTTFTAETITLERVYDTLLKISKLEGKGSQDMKMKYISSLLNDATPIESKFILKILLGTLRLGIAENTTMDALAIAFTNEKSNRELVENAYNVSSDLGKVSEVLATEGINGILKFTTSLFSPIRPMLADRVKSEDDAFKKIKNDFAAEYKLDGERAQIHKKNNEIVLFSRSLENITRYYPDVVEKISKCINANDGIFEAEIVAVNENTGNFLPFQELMHRRRKYKLEQAVSDYPITVNFFDVLYYNQTDYLEKPYMERRKTLENIIKENNFAKLVPMSIVSNEGDVTESLENSINSGCEGLMLKVIDSPYRAGTRGNNWLKLKREYQNELGDSLDLVVVGAFFGRGRRTGKYGTLLLSSYNSESDTFPTICKVGTGFTDENLDQLFQILSSKVTLKKNPRVESTMEADIWFEPELVLEIVASEISLSPIHKTGLNMVRKDIGFALRFPKFTGKIRSEKSAEDASVDEEVLALYKNQKKSEMN
jgi:DNA ligase-1|tara:strand:+ start:390 stop:2144 length:1755 start_codon:yes stop_codon:yes gene_type:complete